MRLRRLAAIAMLVMLFGVPDLGFTKEDVLWPAQVLDILDGDFLVVRFLEEPPIQHPNDFSFTAMPIRLEGIDTPRSSYLQNTPDCYGEKAKGRLEELAPLKSILYLGFDEHPNHDRGAFISWLFAYAFSTASPEPARMINARLVQEGLATTLPLFPNYRYAEIFEDLQQKAKDVLVGIWGFCLLDAEEDLSGLIIERVSEVAETVTIRNTTGRDLSLSGVKLQSGRHDSPGIGQEFRFPAGCILPDNAVVKVISGPDAIDQSHQPFRSKTSECVVQDLNGEKVIELFDRYEGFKHPTGYVWSNEGDIVWLRDINDNIIDACRYGDYEFIDSLETRYCPS